MGIIFKKFQVSPHFPFFSCFFIIHKKKFSHLSLVNISNSNIVERFCFDNQQIDLHEQLNDYPSLNILQLQTWLMEKTWKSKATADSSEVWSQHWNQSSIVKWVHKQFSVLKMERQHFYKGNQQFRRHTHKRIHPACSHWTAIWFDSTFNPFNNIKNLKLRKFIKFTSH